MIGKRSVRDHARHSPDDELTVSKGFAGYYVLSPAFEALEYYTLRQGADGHRVCRSEEKPLEAEYNRQIEASDDKSTSRTT